MSVFETETMAELCVKQGLLEDALAMYRRLAASAADDVTRARREARLAELSRQAAPDPATGGAAPALALERRGDALVFSWAVTDDVTSPALQLLLLRRGPDGVETETRTLTLDGTRGLLTLTVASLHSLRAAVGWLDGDRFVPLARL